MAPFPGPTAHADYYNGDAVLAGRALGYPISSSTTTTSSSPTEAPTTTTSDTALGQASPTSTATDGSGQGGQWIWGGSKSQILNWAAIAVVVGLMIAVALWRAVTLRHRSWKGFFLPRGLKIKWLGIDIKPPPPAPPRPTFLEMERERRQRRADERFQRRRTRGDNIASGGQRLDGGVRDEDDDADDYVNGADRESLPGYKADTSAPIYLEEWRQQAVEDGRIESIDEETAEAVRRSGPVVEAGGGGGEQTSESNRGGNASNGGQLLSVAEYEARIMGNTSGEISTERESEAAAQGESSRTTMAGTSDNDDQQRSSRPSTPRGDTSNGNTARTAEHQHTSPPTTPASTTPQHPAVAHLRRPEPARMPSTGPPDYENLSRRPSTTSQRRLA